MSTRRATRWSIALLIIVGLLPLMAVATSPTPVAAQIDAAVLQQTTTQQETTFWVVMRQHTNLQAAFTVKDWGQRGRLVVNRLQATANSSQAEVLNLLQRRGARHQSFWLVNAIKVTGNAALVKELATRPEIERIIADGAYEIPKPIPSKDKLSVNNVEWNIDRIRAPEVWSTFGDRGEGIVVANIDSGVQFDHPALVMQYRGRQADGSFDHNYNWYDPSSVCGSPGSAPCDTTGHGSHTMGTMLGDDGDPGVNQIGVAPHARWIAAKGCEDYSCSYSALVSAGQWMLAPTDMNGQNPRPEMRPHIINNSWGGGGNDAFYQSIVQAWVAAGMFPAFSNGNSGPYCSSAGSPGDYPESYAAGAFDSSNQIASFSSRGPSQFGGESGIKPNIAAPGVSVRSSVPNNSYAYYDGTSMASPHVAGTVALIWSVAPALIGDVAATRDLLDQTAIDTSDLSCGGTEENNNVWGEGRLDAFAAVSQAPRGPTGTLQGTVTDATTGNPITGATISITGPIDRTTFTDSNGNYSVLLAVGTYTVTARMFGYLTETVSEVTVSEDATTVQNFALEPAPRYAVSGYVRNNEGEPVPNATVTILNTPLPPTTTDANGFYRFESVPAGEYDVRATADGCTVPETQHLIVDSDETLDLTLDVKRDAFGYVCDVVPADFIAANTVIGLNGDDSATAVSLPFIFPFYDQSYTTAYVSTNGFLNFQSLNSNLGNVPLPDSSQPNAAIYPFWDDLYVDGSASVRTELLGTAPNRRFVIEWRDVTFCCITGERVSFEVVLYEDGRILTQYRGIDDIGRERGDSATIGIENGSGSIALQYSYNSPVLPTSDFAVLYRLPNTAFVTGQVLDANDGLGVPGATVRALQEGIPVSATTTDSNGAYLIRLPLGTYTIEVSAENYTMATATVTLDEESETITQNFTLATGRAEISPAALSLILRSGESRTRTFQLTNSGSVALNWEIKESGGRPVQTSSTFGLQKNPKYDPNARTTRDLYTSETPAGWAPTSPGDVLRSWAPTGLSLAWGVGFTGDVWLSDVANRRNHEFSIDGSATGRSWDASWSGGWPADMAYDSTRGLMCQVDVGGTNGIYCWNPANGTVVDSITGSFPWTSTSQRGLAYRSDDDTFYIGGWNEGIIYHVKGLSHADKGAVIGQCRPADGSISGLAWNEAAGVLWVATNSPTDTIYELNPSTCEVLATLAHPQPYYNGGGLEMDAEGNLWMISQSPNMVYLVESGVPAFSDVPWLSESPQSGTIDPGGSQSVAVTIDTSGMSPGVYAATLFISSNSGRQPTLRIPVSLIISAYRQGVNAGGNAYTDREEDGWATDQRWTSSNGWGYVERSQTRRSNRPIAGTDDDTLYQVQRIDPYAYRFDNMPSGVYQIELRFAELQNQRIGRRLFDVIVENTLVLPSYDIAYEVGSYTADDHSFFVEVTDGRLDIRFIRQRGYDPPIINALRVTQRPDR